MAIPIYVLGEYQNYVEIKTDGKSIQNAFQEEDLRAISNNKILENLKNKPCISAGNLIPYGIAKLIRTDVKPKKTIPVGLGNFFEDITTYATNHGAEQAVLQDLQIDYSKGTSEISGLVQLLINK